MKAGFRKPTNHEVNQYLSAMHKRSTSYPDAISTRTDFRDQLLSPLRNHYNFDENQILLGRDKAIFERAKAVMKGWKMFPENWTCVYPEDTPLEPGRRIVVLFRLMGIWWWNPTEIQYTIDESDRFGFAYGTLPGHAESGEELFLVETDGEGNIWYRIKAVSRPAHWLVRLVSPFARAQQKRFVRRSLRQMKKLMEKSTGHE